MRETQLQPHFTSKRAERLRNLLKVMAREKQNHNSNPGNSVEI